MWGNIYKAGISSKRAWYLIKTLSFITDPSANASFGMFGSTIDRPGTYLAAIQGTYLFFPNIIQTRY